VLETMFIISKLSHFHTVWCHEFSNHQER